MRRRRGWLAKLLSVPVLAVCGFALAATMAGVGMAGGTSTDTTTSPTTPPPTTVPTTTTTTTTTTQPTGEEGCTPGFWKNHPEAWVGFTPDQTLGMVFDPVALGELAGTTLGDALSFQGGSGVIGAKQILLRAAVAALLNAAHPDIDYPLTTAQVIAQVNVALASNDRETILLLATTLDALNNATCPIDD
jgi:hypothetical protein